MYVYVRCGTSAFISYYSAHSSSFTLCLYLAAYIGFLFRFMIFLTTRHILQVLLCAFIWPHISVFYVAFPEIALFMRYPSFMLR